MLFVPIKLICFVVVTKRICSTLNAGRHSAVPTKVPATRKLRTVWKLQHWRTTNFVGNVILIKKKNSFNSFKLLQIFFRFYSFLFHNRLSLELSPKIWTNVEQNYCFVQKLITFTKNAGLNTHIISSLDR